MNFITPQKLAKNTAINAESLSLSHTLGVIYSFQTAHHLLMQMEKKTSETLIPLLSLVMDIFWKVVGAVLKQSVKMFQQATNLMSLHHDAPCQKVPHIRHPHRGEIVYTVGFAHGG